jgi:hypothetical protein
MQVAAEELVDLGVEWVILGHSERRQIIGESNQFVGDKVAYALEQKLKVMACIGETINQRENGQVPSPSSACPDTTIVVKVLRIYFRFFKFRLLVCSKLRLLDPCVFEERRVNGCFDGPDLAECSLFLSVHATWAPWEKENTGETRERFPARLKNLKKPPSISTVKLYRNITHD